jgi:predicted MPP superfamily phosphohydrolase
MVFSNHFTSLWVTIFLSQFAGVDEYDLGLFRTESGPLYVTSGIGWFPIPIRFNCRPEITAIEI